MKIQGDNSFLTDGHKAILNKLSSKTKTNRKRTNIDNKNKPQQKHRLGTVSNKLLEDRSTHDMAHLFIETVLLNLLLKLRWTNEPCHKKTCLRDCVQVWLNPVNRSGSRKPSLSPHPTSILILTDPRRYLCCGSLLLLVLAVRIYTLVHLLC